MHGQSYGYRLTTPNIAKYTSKMMATMRGITKHQQLVFAPDKISHGRPMNDKDSREVHVEVVQGFLCNNYGVYQ